MSPFTCNEGSYSMFIYFSNFIILKQKILKHKRLIFKPDAKEENSLKYSSIGLTRVANPLVETTKQLNFSGLVVSGHH